MKTLRKNDPFYHIFAKEEDKKPYGSTGGIIPTWRNPYDEGYSTTYARKVTFQPGVTVLVGCNGSGKTTLIKNIKDNCRKEHVACIDFDNLKDGGHNSISSMLYSGNTGMAAALWSASEGEALMANIGIYAKDVGEAIRDEFKTAPELWVLMDASDSGLSIDNVLDVKSFLDLVMKSNQTKDVYIVIAANEYEMAHEEACLDVMSGKYVTIRNYEEYRKFILDSRKRKEKRLAAAAEKSARKGGKE